MPLVVPGRLSRLLGEPEGATPARLQRILRRGMPALRVRAVRELGLRQDPQAVSLLEDLLGDPVPGVRRAAAWSLARGEDPAHAALLLQTARAERCDEVRLMMAAASVRCGESVAVGWAAVEAGTQREMATFYGSRRMADAIGAGVSAQAHRWSLLLQPDGDHHAPQSLTPQPMQQLRQQALAGLKRDPEDRRLLKILGAQQHPEDFSVLQRSPTGRRTRHVAAEALGMHGDPRALPVLAGTLKAIPDPGQGFASRRVAGEALGRLGCPEAGPMLARALEQEALEFEGRPGAGLGVQFPVRSVLLVSLGESGASDQGRVLAGYLSNTHGSALGGFYLPAMDALWKLDVSEPLLMLLRSDEELVVANAIGVLGAMGRADAVRALEADPRQRVATAVRYVLERA